MGWPPERTPEELDALVKVAEICCAGPNRTASQSMLKRHGVSTETIAKLEKASLVYMDYGFGTNPKPGYRVTFRGWERLSHAVKSIKEGA